MTTFFRFLNIILAALLAGTSFGICVGFNPANLTPSTYIEMQQNMLKTLNTLMVSLVVIATLITITSAFLQKKSQSIFIMLLIAALFFISCILISRFGNQPIQDDMLKWNINSLPNNWRILRDKWWSFHLMRTAVELIALSLVAWASIQKSKYPSIKSE